MPRWQRNKHSVRTVFGCVCVRACVRMFWIYQFQKIKNNVSKRTGARHTMHAIKWFENQLISFDQTIPRNRNGPTNCIIQMHFIGKHDDNCHLNDDYLYLLLLLFSEMENSISFVLLSKGLELCVWVPCCDYGEKRTIDKHVCYLFFQLFDSVYYLINIPTLASNERERERE